MQLISTRHTQSAFRIFYAFLNNCRRWTIIAINAIFLFVYAFLIYVNVDKLPLLITYSIILGLSLAYLVSSIINEFFINKETNKLKITIKVVEISRYVFRFGTIAFNYVDYFNFNHEKSILIATILSTVLFLLQIIFLVVISTLKKYVKLFEIAINKDLEESFLPTIINPGKSINKALEKYADSLEGIEKISKEEVKIIDKLEKEITIYNKEKKEQLVNERNFQLERIKIVYKNKFEEQITTKKASEIFTKCLVKADSIINDKSKYEAVLKEFVNGYEQIDADEKVKEIVFKLKQLINDFLNNKLDLKKEDLAYIVGFVMSFAQNAKYLFIKLKNKKVISAFTNLFISNKNIKYLLEAKK